MHFEIYQDSHANALRGLLTADANAHGEWRWRLRAANGQIIATSGEGYVARHDCEHGIDLVKSTSSVTQVKLTVA